MSTPPVSARKPKARKLVKHPIPSGESFACVEHHELEVMYVELVQHDVYFQHGITLTPDSVVVDVGANIGMFAWHVQQKAKGARVYSFEPLPPTFAALSENVRALGLSTVEPINMGLSSQARTARFTFYPYSAGWSTMYPLHSPEFRATMKDNILAYEKTPGYVRALLKVPGLGSLLSRAITAVQLSHEEHECRLGRLSDFIAERKLERIDLLKVDVERAELEVLEGIDEGDWGKIRQAVIEVQSDVDKTLRYRIRALLDAKGFRVVEQDLPYVLPEGTPPNCLMFCFRSSSEQLTRP